MRIATETVWATAKGKLVEAGDKDAAFLVASKGHPVPDKKLEQFSKADVGKFFKDAVFDRHGTMELPKPEKQPDPITLSRLDTPKETKAAAETQEKRSAEYAKELAEKKKEIEHAAPKPHNREDAQHKKLRKRKK